MIRFLQCPSCSHGLGGSRDAALLGSGTGAFGGGLGPAFGGWLGTVFGGAVAFSLAKLIASWTSGGLTRPKAATKMSFVGLYAWPPGARDRGNDAVNRYPRYNALMSKSDAATTDAYVICLLTTGWFTVGPLLLIWYINASGSSGQGESTMWGVGGALLTFTAWPLSIVKSFRGCNRNPTRFAKVVCVWSLLLIPLSFALAIASCMPFS